MCGTSALAVNYIGLSWRSREGAIFLLSTLYPQTLSPEHNPKSPSILNCTHAKPWYPAVETFRRRSKRKKKTTNQSWPCGIIATFFAAQALEFKFWAGSSRLPVTVLKGALLRGFKGVLITPITQCGNSCCKGE